jgi:hypothetical protein
MWRKKTSITITALLIIVGLTSCATSQIYAGNKKVGTYFVLPKHWHLISNKLLNQKEAESTAAGAADKLLRVQWQEAYSTELGVTPADVFSLNTPKGALAYIRVRTLSASELNSASYNSLRDIVVPISQWVSGTDKSAPEFSITDDFEIVDKGGRGVRTIYDFTGSDNVSQTVDQSAMISNDHRTLYILLIRSTTKFYKTHKKELTKIADSLTVRGAN